MQSRRRSGRQGLRRPCGRPPARPLSVWSLLLYSPGFPGACEPRVSMSFRLFIYYCALCGGGGGFAGWAMGRLLHGATPLLDAGLKALLFGMPVALALSLVDALCNLSLRQIALVIQRVTVAVLVGGVGGFFGGLISHSLVTFAPPIGPGLGWAVAGALIGVAPAMFDLMVAASSGLGMRGPGRKMLN